jgi:hypothetical protein
MDLTEIGWGGMDCINLAQYIPVEASYEYCNEPSDYIKCWEVLEKLQSWRLPKKASVP